MIIQSFIDEPGIDEESLLARSTSATQLYGMHENVMAQGVGGLIWGIRVCAGQTKWQDDTAFIVHAPSRDGSPLVMAGVRNDVLIVYSSNIQALRYFGHHFLTDKSWAKWWEDAWPALPHGFGDGFDSTRWRYCVIFRSSEKRVALVRRTSLDVPSKCVTISVSPPSIVFLGRMTRLMGIPLSSAQKIGYGYFVE